jgi:hypothetical protein
MFYEITVLHGLRVSGEPIGIAADTLALAKTVAEAIHLYKQEGDSNCEIAIQNDDGEYVSINRWGEWFDWPKAGDFRLNYVA